jgi:hypothetical protein
MKRLAVIFLIMLASSSCTKDKVGNGCSGDCMPDMVSYESDIKPLIMQSCATNNGPGTGCHDAWIFEYENVLASVQSGVFKRVILEDMTMPKIPNNFNIQSLTPDELKLFECWICDGAPNN